MTRCGESAVNMASMLLVLPPMYCAAANLSTAAWKVASCDLAVSNAAWSAVCFASAWCCAASLLSRSSWAECIASVVRSAWRDSSVSFASASPAGSACTFAARIPPSNVSADIAYMTGRLSARVVRCLRSNVKILNPQTAVGESPRTVLGLRQVTKRHQPCRNERRKFNSLSEFFGRVPLPGVSSGDESGIAGAVNRHKPQPRGHPRLSEHLQRRALVGQQGVGHPQQHAHDTVRAAGTADLTVIAVDGHRSGVPGLVHLTVLSIGFFLM